MVLGHFGPKKPAIHTQTKPPHTHTPTQTQRPLRCPTPRWKPNLEYQCQDSALKENQKAGIIFFFFLPVRHSLVDLPSTNSLAPSRKMIIGSAFFHSLSACAPGHCLIRNFHRLSIFCFAVIWNIAFLRGKN